MAELKTTKEQRAAMRRVANCHHPDRPQIDLLDDIDTLLAQLAAARELLERWISNNPHLASGGTDAEQTYGDTEKWLADNPKGGSDGG